MLTNIYFFAWNIISGTTAAALQAGTPQVGTLFLARSNHNKIYDNIIDTIKAIVKTMLG